jgi:dsRNA-specific ribonuclease
VDQLVELKRVLKLDQYFPGMDDDLLLLSITQISAKLPKDIRQRLQDKYILQSGYETYQSLEFYGDTVLNMLVVDELSSFLHLNVSPGELTSIK